ncbi:MAG: thiamine pyrophosphate-binding protein [Pseudomonadales bacterium]
MGNITGGDLIYQALRALEVEHVFGIVSVHNIPIYDAIKRGGGISPIDVRHEQAGLHMADAYARATNKLGVAITSTGPGACNAMAGLFEAGFASSRVMMITGQVDLPYYGKGKGVLHEAERQVAMLRSVTRRTESVREVDDIADAIFRVAHDILSGRPQPGAVEVPVDLQYAETAERALKFNAPARRVPDEGRINEAAAALGEATKRVIWAGGGVISAGASQELLALAEALRAPVFTTANGRGAIPEDHELAMGPLTTQPGLRDVIREADVVLAVGTRFQGGSTANFSLEIGGRLIHVDVDPGVVGLNYRPDVTVMGDARVALAALCTAINAQAGDAGFLAKALELRDEARAGIREQMGPDHEIIMDTIRELLPRSGNIVRDATVPAYIWGNRLIPIVEPNTSFHPTSAAIGPGLPLAIGAAVGSGSRTVVIQGDGGFMLSIAELATAAQYSLPVIVCVFNDGGYGVLRSIQRARFDGRTAGVDLHTPDFAGVAAAMGMKGFKVKGADAFREAFKEAVDHEGPSLLDIDMASLAPLGGMFGGQRQQQRRR